MKTKQQLTIITILIFFFTTKITAQNLVSVDLSNANPEAIIYGETIWLDTNNDNLLEFIITGASDNYDHYSGLFTNNNNTFSLDTNNPLQGLSLSSIDKSDFNNDGFIDFIMTGYNGSENVTNLYLNNGLGDFILQTTNIVGASNGRIRVADLNNDNLTDVIITGLIDGDYDAKLYFQNSQGGFDEDTSANLMKNYFGDITFIDINNDSYLDLIITGFDTNFEPNTKLYLNDLGTFTEVSNHGIKKYYFTNSAVADIDKDGDMDFVISGIDSSYTEETALYLNDGLGVFTKETLSFEQVYFGDLSFVDFNNDTFLDVFITGQDANANYTSNLYINDQTTNFVLETAVSDSIIGVAISSCDWNDFDNDGDMDLIISGFNNNAEREIKVYQNTLNTVGNQDYFLNETTISPNPVDDKININSIAKIDRVVIYNSQGQRVSKFNNTTELDVKTLEKGIYILSIYDENNIHKMIKFIKQ